MAMVSSPTRTHAIHAMALPSTLYLQAAGISSANRLTELLIVESDNEWWFNPDTVAKHLKLDGLNEHQENVKLYTGFTQCPKCANDLAPEGDVGFFDYDIDTVRIQYQFACKKCRHQWGPKASGPRDATLVGVAAAPRAPTAPHAPRAKTAGGPSVRDQIHAIINPLRDQMGLADWAAFRKVAIERCTAAGINPGSTTTELPRWRKVQE